MKDIKKETKKTNWSLIKERTLSVIKFVVFAAVMLMGFWTIYTILWFALGFPGTKVALILLLGQALISELMFFKWFNT